MEVTQGTWGAISPIFNYDFGLTEKLPFSYTNKLTESALVNPNQPSPAYNIMGQPNFSVPTNTSADTPNTDQNKVLGDKITAPQQPSGGGNNNGGNQKTTSGNKQQNPQPQPTQGGGVDWSSGLTGEQVRALGMNPDAMVATNGKYYGPNGGGDGGGGQPQIDWDAMYAPSFNALGDLANFLTSNRETSRGNLTSQYDTTKGQIGEEQGNLEAGLAEQQRQLGESGRSAAAEALRSYNALMQQNLSRYGLSTGAGQFLSDLVGQEYLRSRSGINQQMQSGQNQLALEGQKTKQYISKKIGDLDMWKNEAFQKIDEDFQSKMYDINAQKGVLERDKQQQKMAVLQDTLNYQRQVEQQDRQFRMDLANFAVQNLQNVTGQTYTPQEIAAVVNDMMGREISGITQSTGNQVAYTPFGARNYTDEQLKRLNPLQS